MTSENYIVSRDSKFFRRWLTDAENNSDAYVRVTVTDYNGRREAELKIADCHRSVSFDIGGYAGEQKLEAIEEAIHFIRAEMEEAG